MTTVVDSNVLVALWDGNPGVASAARAALDGAMELGQLVAPAPVFAELMAGRGRTEAFLDEFFRDTAIRVDWEVGERIWRAAGRRIADMQTDGGGTANRGLAEFLLIF
jgi:predicted nucleic acid-binding protein